MFNILKKNNKVGLSIKDGLFLDIMNREMFMDDTNSWVAALPFMTLTNKDKEC